MAYTVSVYIGTFFNQSCFPVGTYNSQYLVLDLNRVSLDHSISEGALTVVEQIPGLVLHSDQTQALRLGKDCIASPRPVDK